MMTQKNCPLAITVLSPALCFVSCLFRDKVSQHVGQTERKIAVQGRLTSSTPDLSASVSGLQVCVTTPNDPADALITIYHDSRHHLAEEISVSAFLSLC